MTQFYARFSTGDAVKRCSDRQYVSATALVHKVTGEIKNVTFSTGVLPRPNWTGVTWPIPQWISGRDRARCRRENELRRLNWTVEHVAVERVG